MIHTCDTYTWFIHVIFCNIIPTSRVDYAVRIDMPKGSSPKKSEGFYVHWPARTCISWDMPHNYGLYNPLVSGTAPPSMAKWWLNVQDWNHQQVARNRSGKAPASRTNLLFFLSSCETTSLSDWKLLWMQGSSPRKSGKPNSCGNRPNMTSLQ